MPLWLASPAEANLIGSESLLTLSSLYSDGLKAQVNLFLSRICLFFQFVPFPAAYMFQYFYLIFHTLFAINLFSHSRFLHFF